MRLIKRPRFLLDLAQELTWLNQKAGPEVAEHWYQSLPVMNLGRLHMES